MITSVPGRVCPTCDGNGLLGPNVPCNVCQGSGVVPVAAPTLEPRTDADLDAVYDLERCLRKLEEYPAARWVAASLHNVASAGCRRALRAEARVDQLQREFDLRWKATQRAIDRWRAEDPAGRKLEQPDHADLCCWLMDRMTTVEAECKRLRDELATERTVLRRTADALAEFAGNTHKEELTTALVAALRKRLAKQQP